jgi:hypothetical protein
MYILECTFTCTNFTVLRCAKVGQKFVEASTRNALSQMREGIPARLTEYCYCKLGAHKRANGQGHNRPAPRKSSRTIEPAAHFNVDKSQPVFRKKCSQRSMLHHARTSGAFTETDTRIVQPRLLLSPVVMSSIPARHHNTPFLASANPSRG